MKRKWSLSGDDVEAPNGDVTCQRIWLEAPDDDACTISFTWQIEAVQYGEVELSGDHAAMLVRSEAGMVFDPDVAWKIVGLYDEMADDDQGAALNEILMGRAGGIFAAAVNTHVENPEVATAPFSDTRDRAPFSVDGGEILLTDTVGQHGCNEELGTMAPHPCTKSTGMATRKPTTATVSDNHEFTGDVSENNVFFCAVELATA